MNCENRVVRQYRGNDADRTAVRTTTKKAVRNARSVCSTAVSCSTAGPQSAVSKAAHFGAYRTTSFTRGRKWYDHLIRPSLTRNSAHEIDLIRQAQQLASKPSQLIPAERWPLGFNAGLVEHAAELIRTKTAGRGMAHQRTRQALCRRSIFPCSSRTLLIHIETANRSANSVPVARTANGYKDCCSGQTLACTRHRSFDGSIAGETSKPGEIHGLSWGPLSDLRGVGGGTGSLGIFELRCQFRGGRFQNLRLHRVRR